MKANKNSSLRRPLLPGAPSRAPPTAPSTACQPTIGSTATLKTKPDRATATELRAVGGNSGAKREDADAKIEIAVSVFTPID